MPRVSAYELEHISDEVTFEKVRNKKSKQPREAKYPEKSKKHREKKIAIWDLPEEDE